MKLNKQQLISLSKEYSKLFLLYIVIQLIFIALGWGFYNCFRCPENYVTISKWPDWLMCLVTVPALSYVIKYKVEREIEDEKITN